MQKRVKPDHWSEMLEVRVVFKEDLDDKEL